MKSFQLSQDWFIHEATLSLLLLLLLTQIIALITFQGFAPFGNSADGQLSPYKGISLNLSPGTR